MYTLERARYRKDRMSGRWAEGDLSNEPVTTLTTKFGAVVLYIRWPGPGTGNYKALDFYKVTSWLNDVSPTMTVQGWLTSIGNKTLPFEAEFPSEKENLVRYAQAWHAGYVIQPRSRVGHALSESSKFMKEDLIMTHPTHDYAGYDKFCLTTVNGYFHITDFTEFGIRIVDGNKSVRRANDNQIGVYSFETIGEITKHPITIDMLTKPDPDYLMADNLFLTVPPDIDIDNKTVLLVVGGYLQVLGKTFLPVSERTFKVSLGSNMFLDRYIQSVRQLDVDRLGLTLDPKSPTLMSTKELFSDQTTLRYMTLSQSFLVVVDSPSLFQEYEPVESLHLPGRFIDKDGPNLPMVGAYGKMLDYHRILEVDTFVYDATINPRYNYDALHTAWQTRPLVDGGRYPALPFYHDDAFFRILGTN